MFYVIGWTTIFTISKEILVYFNVSKDFWNASFFVNLLKFDLVFTFFGFSGVRGKFVRKWVESIHKIVSRRLEMCGRGGQAEEQREITFGFDRSPPPIEWHLVIRALY